MKIVLYSGGDSATNQQIDKYLKEWVYSKKQPPSFTYVPSNSEGLGTYFPAVKQYYNSYGINDFRTLLVDKPISTEQVAEALSSDIIYLSGGNAFHFLNFLKISRFGFKLKEYVEKGGILLGVSAGAVVLTPKIITATIPHYNLDKNEVALKDLNGLNLVDFEFTPHYNEEPAYTQELVNYSKQNQQPIYAASDGSGIVLEDGNTYFVGKVYKFHKGKATFIK